MVFIFLFLFEIFVLFVFSRQITQSVAHIFYIITKSETWTIFLLALVFFPGTVIHELSHFFMAILLFVPVGSIEFIPKMHGDRVKLGSVTIGKTDPFRRALIGLAPLLVGLALLVFSIFYFIHFPLQPWYVNITLLLVIIFEIGNTMFSSKRDVEGIPTLVIASGIIVCICYVAGIRFPSSWFSFLFSQPTLAIFQQIVFYMAFPLGVDGVLVVLGKFVLKRY